MAERVYEGLFLFDSNKYSRNPKEVPAAVTGAIEKCGGEILVSRLWAEQKLAYPINGQRKGTYWLTYFKMDSLRSSELNQTLRLNTDLMRQLILTVDERLVDALVSHAGGTVESKDAAPSGDAPSEDKPAEPVAADAEAT